MDATGRAAGDGGIGRRDVLRGAIGLPLALAAGNGGRTTVGAVGDDEPMRTGLISRQRHPENLEFPLSTLNTECFLTPNPLFYVRTHFEVPDLDATAWRLAVQGEVDRPFEMGYDELRRMPSKTMTALLECSGNGRGFLEPPQVGIR